MMKKKLLILILGLISIVSYGQIEPFNYELQDSLINLVKNRFPLSEYDKLEHFMFFNSDTIVVAGYISKEVHNSPKNIIYKTTNRGFTWKQIKFSGDAWIYDTDYKKNGKIWMGGSDEFIHYSDNYGESWEKFRKPFKPVNRVLSIYMVDSLFGIAGGLDNGLAITTDNWLTTTQIPTPLDQGKFTITKKSSRNRVDKIAIFDSLVLINQNDHIYFSSLNPINWETFNIPVRNFTIDNVKQEIYLESLKGKLYVLGKKLNLKRIDTIHFPMYSYVDTSYHSIETKEFFSHNIVSVEIISVKYDFDRMSGGCLRFPLYKENIQLAKYLNSDSLFVFKSKGYSKKESAKYSFTHSDLSEIFNSKNINYKLSQTSDLLNFGEDDYDSFLSYYDSVKQKRVEEKVWGGDFTYLININDSSFINYKSTLNQINSELVIPIYEENIDPFLYQFDNKPYFRMTIINAQNDTLIIDNKTALHYSLPWEISLSGHKTISYSPLIAKFIQTIIPNDFNNNEMFLGGELMYLMINKKIINDLEYKRPLTHGHKTLRR
ncbi:WD40/YVTN/BNR-like repeat-containing protein [Ancylomarina sp. YFZ004]